MISSRSSRNSSTSSMLATVCSSALLLIAFLGNHVTDACSCLPPPDDPCPALLSSNLLVRATIIDSTKVWDKLAPLDANGDPDDPHDQLFTNHYSVKIEEVYVNAGAPSVVEGQTIEIRAKVASNLCGMRLQPDMLLDLSGPYLESNVEYFSTNSCSMSANFDEKGGLSYYNQCFENTLRLKGQTYVASHVAPSLGPVDPPTEVNVGPKDPLTPTKAKKKKQAAKKALKKKKKKKKKAATKALKKSKAQNNQSKLWEECLGKCQGSSTGAFEVEAKTKCQKRSQCTCEKGVFKCKTYEPKVPYLSPICPASIKNKLRCAKIHAPVICKGICTYPNECEASTFGWNTKECVRTN
jgi:hypothetical protein